MRAIRLFLRLTLFYVLFFLFMFGVLHFVPEAMNHLPVGGAQSLLAETGNDPFANIEVGASEVSDLRGSMVWVTIAIIGSLIAAWPVSWTYIASRKGQFYNESIVRTILILPMILTSIVLIVHNSLALAFSLAGIVSAIRFRNTLKDPGDALFILISIGIGLAGGIGALEIALAMTMAVNYASVLLWITEFGVKGKGDRYMRRPYIEGQKDMPFWKTLLSFEFNPDIEADKDDADNEKPLKGKPLEKQSDKDVSDNIEKSKTPEASKP